MVDADDADLESQTTPDPPLGLSLDADTQLAEWRVSAAVEQRRSVRDEMAMLHAEATMDLTVMAVATSGDVVCIETRGGRRLIGRIVAVGADVVVVDPRRGVDDGSLTTPRASSAIRTADICSLSSTPDGNLSSPRWAAPQPTHSTLMFDHLMAELAERGAQVYIQLAGGASTSGTIKSLGIDVLVLVDDSNRVSYLRLDGLSVVSSMSMTSS